MQFVLELVTVIKRVNTLDSYFFPSHFGSCCEYGNCYSFWEGLLYRARFYYSRFDLAWHCVHSIRPPNVRNVLRIS